MGLGPQGSVTTRLDGREALARDGSWRGPWRWSAALGQGRRGASAAEGGDGVGSTQGAETAVGTALRAEADEGEESVGEVLLDPVPSNHLEGVSILGGVSLGVGVGDPTRQHLHVGEPDPTAGNVNAAVVVHREAPATDGP